MLGTLKSSNVLGGLLTGVFVALFAELLYNPPVIVDFGIAIISSLGTTLLLQNQERNAREYEKRKHIITSPPPGGRFSYLPEPAQVFGLPSEMSEEEKKALRRTGGFQDSAQ